MELQNNQTVQNYSIDHKNIYQPNNPISYNQNSPQIYQNTQPNQFIDAPQFQCQNNEKISGQQMITNNQNNLISKEPLINFIKDNKLEIPFKKGFLKIIFYIIVLIINIFAIIRAPSFHKIYIGIILFIEYIILLLFENLKIIMIKDESNNKIYLKLINYLCITRKKYIYDLDCVNFKTILSKKNYILLILNNYKNGNEIDLNSSSIKTIPLNFLISFENINVDKFKDQYQLNNILNNFSISPRNQENPLNFNINEYMKRQVYKFNQFDFNKYIKINDNFFTYYDNNPFKKNCKGCQFKFISIVIHFILFIYAIIDEEDNNVKSEFFVMILLYFIFHFQALVFFYIIIPNGKALRIDIIYSSDFDKIFIGALLNGKKKYFSTSEFYINRVNKFYLYKEPNDKRGFHLKALINGDLSSEIFYIEDERTELEGLEYILNKKLNNNDI